MIILTSKDEEIDEILGFNLGADDYIHKPFSQRLLIERVKAVLRRARSDETEDEAQAGGAAGGAKAIKRGRLTLDPARHDCLWDGRPVRLTVTEFLLLQSLAQRPGFVKSRDNLMDAAYDDQVYVDDRTIDSHIKRMRKKFRAGRSRVRRDRNPLWRRLPLPRSLSARGLPGRDSGRIAPPGSRIGRLIVILNLLGLAHPDRRGAAAQRAAPAAWSAPRIDSPDAPRASCIANVHRPDGHRGRPEPSAGEPTTPATSCSRSSSRARSGRGCSTPTGQLIADSYVAADRVESAPAAAGAQARRAAFRIPGLSQRRRRSPAARQPSRP